MPILSYTDIGESPIQSSAMGKKPVAPGGDTGPNTIFKVSFLQGPMTLLTDRRHIGEIIAA